MKVPYTSLSKTSLHSVVALALGFDLGRAACHGLPGIGDGIAAGRTAKIQAIGKRLVGTAAASTAKTHGSFGIRTGAAAGTIAMKRPATRIIGGGITQMIAGTTAKQIGDRSGARKTRSIMDPGKATRTATPAAGTAAGIAMSTHLMPLKDTMNAAAMTTSVECPAAKIAVTALTAAGLEGPEERLLILTAIADLFAAALLQQQESQCRR